MNGSTLPLDRPPSLALSLVADVPSTPVSAGGSPYMSYFRTASGSSACSSASSSSSSSPDTSLFFDPAAAAAVAQYQYQMQARSQVQVQAQAPQAQVAGMQAWTVFGPNASG